MGVRLGTKLGSHDSAVHCSSCAIGSEEVGRGVELGVANADSALLESIEMVTGPYDPATLIIAPNFPSRILIQMISHENRPISRSPYYTFDFRRVIQLSEPPEKSRIHCF